VAKKAYEFSKKVEVVPVSPESLFEGFIERFEKSTWPKVSDSWSTSFRDFFLRMGRELGYEPLTERMRLDVTWHVELPSVRFIELALEYEDWEDEPDELTEEARKKLIHVKSHNKCLVGWFSMAEKQKDTIAEIESIMESAAIKDDSKWLLIFLSPEEKGKITATAFKATSEDCMFKEIGKKILTLPRVPPKSTHPK